MFYSAQMIHQFWINKKATHTTDISIVIIEGDNSENAYKKALKIAKEKAKPYHNIYGKLVEWHFIGLADLQEIDDDKIKNGTEIFCEMGQITSKKHLQSLVRPKKKLLVFDKPNIPDDMKVADVLKSDLLKLKNE